MVDITHGGAWFRWSTLDAQSRFLAAASMGAAPLAGGLIGMVMSEAQRKYGLDLGVLRPVLAPIAVVLTLFSAWCWHGFSRRQDEMFNRIQNWALGVAGASVCSAALIWIVLAKGGWLPHLTSGLIVFGFCIGFCVLWMVGVRKWVS